MTTGLRIGVVGATGVLGSEVLALLEESLLRLSQLVSDFEDDLAELDLNPFIVTERADRSFIVDARVGLRQR